MSLFVHNKCRHKYTSPLWKKQKQENIVDDNCVKSTVLRSEKKVLIEKRVDFSVKKYVS